MSEARFTPDQLRAINEPGNIIVSAGAGSGKTTVMIARIVNKLLSGASLDDMLIVTFTRASAADMRVKLAQKLAALAAAEREKPRPDKAVLSRLNAAIEAMPMCRLGTLHSYCQRLLRSYFFVADVDPTSAICEEGEARLLKLAAARAAVDSALERADERFMAIYDILSSRRSDDGVVETIADIITFALSVADPLGYLRTVPSETNSKTALSLYAATVRERLVARAEQLSERLAAAQMPAHQNVAAQLLLFLKGKANEVACCPTRLSKTDSESLAEKLKDLRADCVAAKKLDEEISAAILVDSEPYVRAMLAVAEDGYNRYAARKKRLGKLDYSDLEQGAYAILSDPKCMADIAATTKYVFIDEFQDVNPLQSHIAKRFKAAGAEMFLVGDIKQSIYGFRCCSPDHFAAARRDPDYTHIVLKENFRSAPQIIDFVNTIFSCQMSEGFGGADYCMEEPVCGDPSLEGEAGIYLVPPSQREPLSLHGGPYSVRRAATAERSDPEASFVADCAARWVRDYPDRGPGSVAILVRSISEAFRSALEYEFAKRNIKISFSQKAPVSGYPSAVCLLDIMRCVDDASDDVALLTALRSPMGGFSDSEIAEISAEGDRAARAAGLAFEGSSKKYTFCQRFACYRGRLSDRVADFVALRKEIAAYSKNHDSSDVLGYITSRIDYFQYLYETGDNARAAEALIAKAADRRCDMHTFLAYCDGTDVELELSGAAGDAVTVTTVHGAKGLEYDFVIVADCAHGFNFSDLREKVIATERGVFSVVPQSDGTIAKSATRLYESYVAGDRLRQEELRLLYVALTRAKKKLVVCGKADFLRDKELYKASCFLDYLVGPVKELPPPLEAGEEESEQKEYLPQVETAVAERIARAKRYAVSELPIKTCVTAIAAEQEDYTSFSPVLTDDDRGGQDSRRRGTAYHRAMELVDFAQPDISALKDGCPDFELVEEGEILRAAAAMNKLCAGAAFVARERCFIADLGIEEGKESSLVQGVIDLLIVDGKGNAIIVDYKTGDPRHLKNAGYAMQLKLYSAAVEMSTPYRVTAKYLYSFASGELIAL